MLCEIQVAERDNAGGNLPKAEQERLLQLHESFLEHVMHIRARKEAAMPALHLPGPPQGEPQPLRPSRHSSKENELKSRSGGEQDPLAPMGRERTHSGKGTALDQGGELLSVRSSVVHQMQQMRRLSVMVLDSYADKEEAYLLNEAPPLSDKQTELFLKWLVPTFTDPPWKTLSLEEHALWERVQTIGLLQRINAAAAAKQALQEAKALEAAYVRARPLFKALLKHSLGLQYRGVLNGWRRNRITEELAQRRHAEEGIQVTILNEEGEEVALLAVGGGTPLLTGLSDAGEAIPSVGGEEETVVEREAREKALEDRTSGLPGGDSEESPGEGEDAGTVCNMLVDG